MATKKVRNRPPQNNANAVEISANSAKVQMDTAREGWNKPVVTTASTNGHDEGESVAVTQFDRREL